MTGHSYRLEAANGDLRGPNDGQLRGACTILSKKGYPGNVSGDGDGEVFSWRYHSDMPVDEGTQNELKAIGVRLR